MVNAGSVKSFHKVAHAKGPRAIHQELKIPGAVVVSRQLVPLVSIDLPNERRGENLEKKGKKERKKEKRNDKGKKTGRRYKKQGKKRLKEVTRSKRCAHRTYVSHETKSSYTRNRNDERKGRYNDVSVNVRAAKWVRMSEVDCQAQDAGEIIRRNLGHKAIDVMATRVWNENLINVPNENLTRNALEQRGRI
jgi:hypothetical protein